MSVKLDPITDEIFVQAESFKMEEVTSRSKKSQEGGKRSKVEEMPTLIQPALGPGSSTAALERGTRKGILAGLPKGRARNAST